MKSLMRRHALGVAVVAVLCVLGGEVRAETAGQSAQTGQALFRQKCGICHLAGGTGTFMLTRRLGANRALLEERKDLDVRLVKQVVRAGIVSMPRFTRAELPDSELQAIADYLARSGAR